MPRDRQQTRLTILNAVGRVLARSGFGGIGVNAIAREAGVDKVLIYRYFGGMPELLQAFAAESGFWPDLPELTPEASQPLEHSTEAERAKALVLAFGRSLRRRPLTQEIMRWELLERNELTDALARYREEQSEQLLQSFDPDGRVDVRAIASLLAAGQTYLILRAKTADVYNGLDLNSEQDWSRLERAAEFLLDAVFERLQQSPAEETTTQPEEPAAHRGRAPHR